MLKGNIFQKVKSCHLLKGKIMLIHIKGTQVQDFI